jgi:hypothetical protein
MITIRYKGLSRKGAGKIRSLQSRVPKAAFKSLRKNFLPTKRAIIGLAPTPGQEKAILSKGDSSLGEIGVSTGGRFAKTGTQRYVKDALSAERPMVSKAGNLVSLKWGNVAAINAKIGFSWVVVVKGTPQTRTTNQAQPLWGMLIQAWEGKKFSHRARITARGNYDLQPEDGKFVRYIDKTITPFHMVEKGYASTKSTYRQSVAGDIRKVASSIGQK